MLSICIPAYNFIIIDLVSALSSQIGTCGCECEIIVIDDASHENFKNANKIVSNYEFVNYIELPLNIGRSKIRNLFLEYSKYDNLLFLDCDSLVVSNDFIKKYIDVIKRNEFFVVCGGRIYDPHRPEKNKMLRWKYGIIKESQPLDIRIKSPNNSFMTNNFLVKRNVFEQIKFDERICQYGHEDTLFGFMLKKKGITINHIDNPVLNGDIEDNIEYLEKTEKGIINLIYILKYLDYNADFIKDVAILNFYNKIDSIKITNIIRFFFFCLKPFFKFFLVQGIVILWLFDFYKLGLLIQNFKYHTTIAVNK